MRGGRDMKAHKYKLWTASNHDRKECVTRLDIKEGEGECQSEHIQFKRHISSDIPDMIDREGDKFRELLSKILDTKGSRMICFHGWAGTGKTYTIRRVLKYVEERKFFPGGMLYFDLVSIS